VPSQPVTVLPRPPGPPPGGTWPHTSQPHPASDSFRGAHLCASDSPNSRHGQPSRPSLEGHPTSATGRPLTHGPKTLIPGLRVGFVVDRSYPPRVPWFCDPAPLCRWTGDTGGYGAPGTFGRFERRPDRGIDESVKERRAFLPRLVASVSDAPVHFLPVRTKTTRLGNAVEKH